MSRVGKVSSVNDDLCVAVLCCLGQQCISGEPGWYRFVRNDNGVLFLKTELG